MIANSLFLTVVVLLALGFWLLGERKFLVPFLSSIRQHHSRLDHDLLHQCVHCCVRPTSEALPERDWPQTLAHRQTSGRRPLACANCYAGRGGALKCATSHPRTWTICEAKSQPDPPGAPTESENRHTKFANLRTVSPIGSTGSRSIPTGQALAEPTRVLSSTHESATIGFASRKCSL
jgi:hypothetical protein